MAAQRVGLVSLESPDTVGCAWTGEIDLNTLRMDGSLEKKNCGFKKYSDTCGTSLDDCLRNANDDS